MYMKYCKVLAEPIVESKDKKKRTKTNKKSSACGKEVEMIVRRWTKHANKLVTKRPYQTRVT